MINNGQHLYDLYRIVPEVIFEFIPQIPKPITYNIAIPFIQEFLPPGYGNFDIWNGWGENIRMVKQTSEENRVVCYVKFIRPKESHRGNYVKKVIASEINPLPYDENVLQTELDNFFDSFKDLNNFLNIFIK